jgi:hypothetical protein
MRRLIGNVDVDFSDGFMALNPTAREMGALVGVQSWAKGDADNDPLDWPGGFKLDVLRTGNGLDVKPVGERGGDKQLRRVRWVAVRINVNFGAGFMALGPPSGKSTR